MTGDAVPRIGLGTYDVDPPRCTAAVATALRLGYRHVDTAEMYGNEAAVGTALDLADVERESCFVSTKVHSTNLAYEDVLDAVSRSRDRLGVEVIDCCYVHWPIRRYDPAETLAAFDELVDRGTIRHVGLSNFTPELLEEAVDVLAAPVFAHQVECHPLLRQEALRRLARRYDHHLVAYSPLAKGDVTTVPEVVSIADRHDATPAQVSLAWLLSKESVVAIPKSTSYRHLRENLAATEIDLDDRDVAVLDGIDRTERTVDVPEAPWNRS